MTELRSSVVAFVVAVVGSLGSVYLSVGLGLKACPLCFYQRSFVMAIAAVLAVGLLTERSRAELLCLVCWPLATAGLAVAVFHEYLVLAGKLECPQALLGLGTAPAQSLALFAILTVSLAVGVRAKLSIAGGGLALGVALALACIVSSPPMPPAPVKPYDKPLDICRPPFVTEEV